MTVYVERFYLDKEIAPDCECCCDNIEEARINGRTYIFRARGTTEGCYFDHIYSTRKDAIDSAQLANKPV